MIIDSSPASARRAMPFCRRLWATALGGFLASSAGAGASVVAASSAGAGSGAGWVDVAQASERHSAATSSTLAAFRSRLRFISALLGDRTVPRPDPATQGDD